MFRAAAGMVPHFWLWMLKWDCILFVKVTASFVVVRLKVCTSKRLQN